MTNIHKLLEEYYKTLEAKGYNRNDESEAEKLRVIDFAKWLFELVGCPNCDTSKLERFRLSRYQ